MSQPAKRASVTEMVLGEPIGTRAVEKRTMIVDVQRFNCGKKGRGSRRLRASNSKHKGRVEWRRWEV